MIKKTKPSSGESSDVEYEEVLSPDQLKRLDQDFARLEGSVYLDHAGATLYSKSQLDSAMKELQENVWGNPHSRNPTSSLTTDAVDAVRQRLLSHFGTTEEEYSVVFTSGATAGLKCVGESFNFNNGGMFAYLEDNHTSVIGVREYLSSSSSVHCFSKSAMETLMKSASGSDPVQVCEEGKNALFAYPAQCNFSGFKYPLEWISKIKCGLLEAGIEATGGQFYVENVKAGLQITKKEYKWAVLLDAASYVASNRLDLSQVKPDFVVMSFYKMFGWPTGLGALLVHKPSQHFLLEGKRYFGGGTVNISIPSRPFHVKRTPLHERLEDGTIPFLSILGVRHGLDSLPGDMDLIRRRTFNLAQYLYRQLSRLKYQNGRRVVKLYSDTDFSSELTQGPLVTFNLLRPDGDEEIIGYSEMEQIAYLHKVSLRYGCFCNPGACRRHLGLSVEDVLKHFQAGHVCGDLRDVVDGKPTGAIRASFGYMSSKRDADYLLNLIHTCWVKPNHVYRTLSPSSTTPIQNGTIISKMKLQRMFVYPIKSCAPFEITSSWLLGPHGLLYDREWLIVNAGGGVPLMAKREPKLLLIQPIIDLESRSLILHFHGEDDSVRVPLELNKQQATLTPSSIGLCNSKVCGDFISGIDCGPNVGSWLSRVLDRPGLRLLRKDPNFHRKHRSSPSDEISLSNQSQFLLLSSESLEQLGKELPPSPSQSLNCEEKEAIEEKKESLIMRFRANFIVGHDEDMRRTWLYEEESWKNVRIDGHLFKSGGPCLRCATICVDPCTGAKGSEPLLTLSRLRGGRPTFGLHLSKEEEEESNQYSQIVKIGAVCDVDVQEKLEEKVNLSSMLEHVGNID